jgi:uncharacterized membrane protein YhaH (DUF805 family)
VRQEILSAAVEERKARVRSALRGTSLMSAYTNAMRRYFELSGRSSRREFWFFVLVYLAMYFIAAVIDGSMRADREGFGILRTVVVLLHVIPAITVSVRRLHDIDRTGWWVLFFWVAPSLTTFVAMVVGGGSILLSLQDGNWAGVFATLGGAVMFVLILDLVVLIAALAFYASPGTPGPNGFGPPPTE